MLTRLETCNGEIFNVGGGREASTSLCELTTICREVTGNDVSIAADDTTASVDIPFYISDSRRAMSRFDWQPQYKVRAIVEDIHAWLSENESQLRPLFT